MLKKLAFITFFIALGGPLQAQNIRPAGLNAYAGFGFAEFDIGKDGSQNLRMDRGLSASIAGERGFGFLNSYLTFTINALRSTGNSNYSYTPLAGTAVTANNVAFTSELFQFALGYKIKLFDNSWFRPFVEVGAVGGYYNLRYSLNSGDILSGNFADAKRNESLFDSGSYGEAGFEIDFSSEFGLKISARQMQMKTAKFETLNNSELEYTANIVFLSVLRAF